MQANSVELSGWVELVDLPGVVVEDPAEHDRIRKSRLADVMIVLERDAAEIAEAIGERLVAQWPDVREANVDLSIAEDAPEFTVCVSAEHDPATAPVDLCAQQAALADILEVEIADAIGRRVAVKRRFSPRIQLARDRPPKSANLPPADTVPSAGSAPGRTGPEIAPMPPLKLKSAGRVWLLALFALIAIVLLGAAWLVALQPR